MFWTLSASGKNDLQGLHNCPCVKTSVNWSRSSIKVLKPTINKLPELVIFGGPLPKSRFSAISATVFHANLINGNIWPRVELSIYQGYLQGRSQNQTCKLPTNFIYKSCDKNMERVMMKSLVSFMDFYHIMDHWQHGSRSGRSTLSQLLQHQDEILQALEDGNNIKCYLTRFL